MSKFNLEFYQKYLQSEKWKKKRKEIYELRKGKCEICKCKLYRSYHVHHKTYKRLGNEINSDLVLLCEKCHVEIHRQVNIKKSSKIKALNSYTCPYCLEKININRFLNSGRTRCPHCNSYVNRLNLIKQLKISKKR